MQSSAQIDLDLDISNVNVNFKDVLEQAKGIHGDIFEESDLSDTDEAMETSEEHISGFGSELSELSDIDEGSQEPQQNEPQSVKNVFPSAKGILSSLPAFSQENPGGFPENMSRKEKKRLRQQQRWSNKTEGTKDRARTQKMLERNENPGNRAYGDGFPSSITVTKVEADISGTARTIPAFIGKTFTKLEADKIRNQNSSKDKAHSSTNHSAGNSHSYLDPDCDEDVIRKVTMEGWKYIINNISTTSKVQVIADKEDRIIAIKAKQPSNDPWPQINTEVMDVFSLLRGKFDATPNLKKYERTRMNEPHLCPIVRLGFSYGGGQTSPQRFSLTTNAEKESAKVLLEDEAFGQVIHHITSCLWTCFPEVAQMYKSLQIQLGITNPKAQRKQGIFEHSPFCGTTVNLGPKAQTKQHKDSRNLVGGLCAIAVFGKFNHKTSGHILLHEIKIIMEVQPGDVLFIPSAGLTHSNSALKLFEDRSSVVQYTAGGLFRWIWNQAKGEEEEDTEEVGTQRWEETIGLIGIVDFLKDNSTETRKGRIEKIKQRIKKGESFLLPSIVV